MLTNTQSQRGVTLVEAMIALLVISIGLLGIASLQLTAMRQNTSALNHSQAVWMAYNISDRIRANGAQFNAYDGIDTTGGYAQDCVNNLCNDIEMVEADATDWATMISNLPGGEGTIDITADGLLVRVMWDDDGTGATGRGCGNDPSVDMACYRMMVAQ